MKKIVWAALVCVALAPWVHAADEAVANISRKLREGAPHLQFGTPVPSRLQGMYEVQVQGGPKLFVSSSGDYFVAGELFKVEPGKLVSIDRVDALRALDRKDMIIFPAKGKARAAVYVFTDIDCGYCRKLHQEVPAINELGIELRYLAFPRAGVGSESYLKMVTAFCSDDRQAALTRLKNGESLPAKTCKNPVAEQYALGQRIGVQGTPAIITEDGNMLPGYMPAAELAKVLGLK